jgi:hypothetical protein
MISNKEDSFETGIGPITDRILYAVVNKLNKLDYSNILADKIVEPVTVIVREKAKPYIYTCLVLYGIVVILLLMILCILMKKK